MPIQKTDIEHFLELASIHPVLDVRSPSEFLQAHIPGAHSLPLFTDEERKVVGTAYKQQSREAAIKIGLDYFGVKMRKMVEEVEAAIGHRPSVIDQDPSSMEAGAAATGHRRSAIDHDTRVINHPPTVLLHCWRGGMRSAAVAWLLDLYGFKVYTLAGGYKKFRRYVLETFIQSFSFTILGGFAGSGKTLILNELAKNGERVIDLEALANHKGSAFGALGQPPQPSQEMFENLLALEIRRKKSEHRNNANTNSSIWLEDESQRIGSVTIPQEIWRQMRKSPVYFLDIPFEARLKHIQAGYGKIEKANMIGAILRIQKRLGGMETKSAIQLLGENKIKECFSILFEVL